MHAHLFKLIIFFCFLFLQVMSATSEDGDTQLDFEDDDGLF